MVRLFGFVVGLAFGAAACASSGSQLHPIVEVGDPNRHLIEPYETVLSYAPASTVAVSGEIEGGEVVFTVALRNTSEDPVSFDPSAILVAAGDPAATVTVLPAFAPDIYLGGQLAAGGTGLAIRAASLGATATENVRVASEATRLDDIPLETAGSLLGRTGTSPDWAALALRSADLRAETEALSGRIESLSEGLLWPSILDPGASTFGDLRCPTDPTVTLYRLVVPVGRDLHEVVLALDPGPAGPQDPVLTSN